MPQFLVLPNSKVGTKVILSSEESHHVRDVFRMKVGDLLHVTDGKGFKFEAKIEKISPQAVEIFLIRSLEVLPQKGNIHLALALLKKDKMEWVIQKSAELGVCAIHPFISERTMGTLKNEAKQNRWQKIADEATKQCGSAHRMLVNKPLAFEEILKTLQADLKILFWEENVIVRSPPLADDVAISHKIIILIGPEGGFSQEEVKLAEDSGYKIGSLGPRILRSETAAIVATTIVQHELGNI